MDSSLPNLLQGERTRALLCTQNQTSWMPHTSVELSFLLVSCRGSRNPHFLSSFPWPQFPYLSCGPMWRL
jgi:hypothetical protein